MSTIIEQSIRYQIVVRDPNPEGKITEASVWILDENGKRLKRERPIPDAKLTFSVIRWRIPYMLESARTVATHAQAFMNENYPGGMPKQEAEDKDNG